MIGSCPENSNGKQSRRCSEGKKVRPFLKEARRPTYMERGGGRGAEKEKGERGKNFRDWAQAGGGLSGLKQGTRGGKR